MGKLGDRRQTNQPVGWKSLLPLSLRRGPGGWTLRIFWPKLALWFVGLAALGWLAGATAVYSFVKYRQGIETARWTEIALPHRWNDFRRTRGEFLLVQAEKDIQAGNFATGFHKLRVGLGQSPYRRDSRILLAKVYASSRRPDLTEKTLLDGLTGLSGDIDYLGTVFSFLLSQQKDAVVIETAGKLLEASTEIDLRTQLIAIAAATASFFRGNFDKSEDLLRRYRVATTRHGRLLAARIDWERGYHEIALGEISRLRNELPADVELYTTEVQWLRDLGREDSGRRASLMRQIEFPDDPRPRVDLLYALDRAGETAEIDPLVEGLLSEFSEQPEALLAVADFAANTGRPALARRVLDMTRARNLPWEGPALMSVEASVVAGRYNDALNLARELLGENPDWANRYYAVFNGLQAVAFFGLDNRESGQLFLNNFLNHANVRAENLVAVSKRLLDIGKRDEARQVLARATAADPLNQAAIASLIELDLEAGRTAELPDSLRRLLAMRKPPAELLRRAYRTMGSDRLILRPGRDELLNELAEFLRPVGIVAANNRTG